MCSRGCLSVEQGHKPRCYHSHPHAGRTWTGRHPTPPQSRVVHGWAWAGLLPRPIRASLVVGREQGAQKVRLMFHLARSGTSRWVVGELRGGQKLSCLDPGPQGMRYAGAGANNPHCVTELNAHAQEPLLHAACRKAL